MGGYSLKRLNPKLVVIIGVLFVSLSSILIKLSNAPSLVIAFYRMLFTTIFLFPFVIFNHVEEIKNLSKRFVILSAGSGLFLAFHFATWFTSIKYTTIASSTILVSIHPVFIVIGGYLFLNEKVTNKILLTISIVLLGSLIISLGDYSTTDSSLYGNILAVFGAFFVSCYMMIGKHIRKNVSLITYTFIVYLTCSLVLLLLVIITRTPLYPYPMQEWLIYLGLSIFCTILGHSIFSWSLKYVKVTFLSTTILGEPVFATIWATLIFNEIPTLWNVLGGVIVILGIMLYIRNDRITTIKDNEISLL